MNPMRASLVILRLPAALVGLAGMTSLPPVPAEDRVTWVNTQQQEETRAGEIIAYNVESLRLRFPQGTIRRIPSDQIVAIHTDRKEGHRRADELFERGDFAAALEEYRTAYRVEPRRWVQHQIVARSVLCLQRLGQVGVAASTFLALLGQDPQTPYLDVVPLAWRSEQAEPALRGQTADWLHGSQGNVARLIAASWSLSGARRLEAVRALRSLMRAESGNWIGDYARTQLWRTRVMQADRQEVQRWQQFVKTMPTKLRAGPNFVVAQALARHQDVDTAVLAYLQVAFMYPAVGELGAEALWAATELLRQEDRQIEARRLLAELPRRYPSSPRADEATRVLQSLDDSQ